MTLQLISERFLPTEVNLAFPVGFAESVVLGGLTPAQLRIALTLMSLCAGKGRHRISRPDLEQLSGVALNATHKILAPIMANAVIEIPSEPDHPANGSLGFSKLDFTPGAKGRRLGFIDVMMSPDAQHAWHIGGAGQDITIPADELRCLGTVGGIILRLSFGALFARDKTSKLQRVRMSPEAILPVFGSYGRNAIISRTSKSGEVRETISLSRAAAVLVEPGVNDINAVSESLLLEWHPIAPGEGTKPRWKFIQLNAQRFKKRPPRPSGFSSVSKGRKRAPTLKERVG